MPFIVILLDAEKVTVYPFIYERVNRYAGYNRYMYLTVWCLYGIVRVFLVLAF